MIGGSYKNMPQRQNGGGKLGFTLSAVPLDECSEILAVCGIHPDALAEPDLALLAARLRATALGDKELWRYRWDHVFINSIRVQNEQNAVGRCESWAEGKGLFFQGSAQRTPNAGYDLLFADAVGVECQVEVKGYAASNLAQVHLQHSQFLRASESASGVPPDWRLFVVLSVDTPQPEEHVFTAQEVLDLVQKGRLQVRWPSVAKAAG